MERQPMPYRAGRELRAGGQDNDRREGAGISTRGTCASQLTRRFAPFPPVRAVNRKPRRNPQGVGETPRQSAAARARISIKLLERVSLEL